jgi:dipeptidyl aminopeptidase/acylaminoacyl peptidase
MNTPAQLDSLTGSGGGVIAYCSQPASGNDLNEDIYAINADGSGNTRIIDAPIGLNYPDWSPDGERLAVIGYVSESTWSIYAFDADGTNLQRLTTMDDVWDTDPSWSPNGSQIAFTRIYPSQNNRAEIWIMNADGSNQHWIGIEGGSAKWSPDGTRLIYHSIKSDNYDVYTCNTAGTNEQQLTSTPDGEITPAWSPDGSQIAVTAVGDDFSHQVYVMNSDGTNLRPLTDGETGAAAPRWSPDGSLIAFKSGGDIYVINTDGTNIRQVINSPTGMKAINPVWRPSTTTRSSTEISCECTSLAPLQTELVYDVEPSRDAGFWSFSTPEEEGMDAALLEAGVAALAEFDNLYSVLILRNDKIVLERYFQEEEPRHARDIASASKSFLSALVGIALREGYIQSVDQTAADFLPTYFASAQDPRKLDITLRHLLTMTLGFSSQDSSIICRGIGSRQRFLIPSFR